MSKLAQIFSAMTDDELSHAFFRKHKEYAPEALALLKGEVNRRNLSAPADEEFEAEEELAVINEEMVPLPGAFALGDATIISAILHDASIPYSTKRGYTSDTFPIESDTESHITVLVPESYLEKALEAIREQFTDTEKFIFARRFNDTRSRLAAFSFSDVHLPPAAYDEIIDSSFTEAEAKQLVHLLVKLRTEADAIEEKRGQYLFFFDNLDHCENRLLSNKKGYTRTDFLTILELLQVYRESEEFPESLDTVASSLLTFFVG